MIALVGAISALTIAAALAYFMHGTNRARPSTRPTLGRGEMCWAAR